VAKAPAPVPTKAAVAKPAAEKKGEAAKTAPKADAAKPAAVEPKAAHAAAAPAHAPAKAAPAPAPAPKTDAKPADAKPAAVEPAAAVKVAAAGDAAGYVLDVTPRAAGDDARRDVEFSGLALDSSSGEVKAGGADAVLKPPPNPSGR
jgi:hypothetical protein